MSIAPDYVTPEEVRDRQLKVYLTSEAGSVNLWPNANGDGLKLHSKVDGLGVADSENTMTSLASGGAIMRHQRLKEGDMQLPIQIKSNSKRARNDLKTQLEQVLQPAKGPVYVHVLDPYSGDTRIRTAYYRTGLGQPEWSGPRSALYGVTLDYAEPWWRGINRGRKVKVADRKKPFITAQVEDGEGNYLKNGNLELGSSEGWPSDAVYESTGGPDGGPCVTFPEGKGYSYEVANVGTMPVTPGETVYFELEIKASKPNSMLYVTVQDQNGPSGSTSNRVTDWTSVEGDSAQSTQGPVAKWVVPTEWTKVLAKKEIPAGVTSLVMQAFYFNHSGGTEKQSGYSISKMGLYKSSGGEIQRVRRRGVGPAIPFFPVFVYSSVVEGVYTLHTEGDEIAWPTWTIHPPGKDLLIENMTTGDKLFIEGEIFEPLTIVTDPHNQDIYSDTWTKGEWWNQVDIKQGTLFPLAAGENKIKITMVGANLESYVEYSYQEMWRAPY